MIRFSLSLLALPWDFLDVKVEQLFALVECLSFNDVNPKLQAIVPKILKGIGLLLLEVVNYLSETLFGHTF